MKKLVLLRHGESTWNKENRFTGWTDVDLSEKGVQEARLAGEVLKREGFVFDLAYTSMLKRFLLNPPIDLKTRPNLNFIIPMSFILWQIQVIGNTVLAILMRVPNNIVNSKREIILNKLKF